MPTNVHAAEDPAEGPMYAYRVTMPTALPEAGMSFAQVLDRHGGPEGRRG